MQKYCAVSAPSWCLLSELFGGIDRGRGMSELILVQTSRYARRLSRVLEPKADVTPDLDLDQNVHNYNVLVMTNNWLSRIHFFLFNLFKTNDLKECNCSFCKQTHHKYLCEQCGFENVMIIIALFGSWTFQLRLFLQTRE